MARKIPVAPSGPAPSSGTSGPSAGGSTTTSGGGSGTTSTGSGSSSAGGGSSSGSKGSSGGGGGGDYRKKAGRRYLDQAANLEAQARALQLALNKSFGKALRKKLSNVNEVLKDQNSLIMEGYRERVASLEGSIEDNEKAQDTQTRLNDQNRVREQGAALTEAMAMGAGESDALQAQMMALRNWQANQGEIQRSLFDTLRSVNSSLNDLNVDTKTARVNLETQANADKEQLWTNYYNQRSEAYTQLGNIRGQQADYKDMAKEYGVGKGGGKNAGHAAFQNSAKELGKAWENPGVSKKLKRWDGRDEFKPSGTGAPRLAAAPSVDLGKKPEGATLRTW